MGRAKRILPQGGSVRRIILIFITVGTHEQGLDRLLVEVDKLIEEKIINDEVFAQIGYCKYIPKNYKFEKMIGYDEMDEWVKKSDIIITHGGPGSIFHPLKYGKTPIVVPRDPKYNEHVDNHQILFTKRLESEGKVIAVFDIKELKKKINDYKILSGRCNINNLKNENFIKEFSKMIEKIVCVSK